MKENKGDRIVYVDLDMRAVADFQWVWMEKKGYFKTLSLSRPYFVG
jgi:hypothetical protein